MEGDTLPSSKGVPAERRHPWTHRLRQFKLGKTAVARHGYTPVVSREAEIVLRADKLFLARNGTAQAAMDQLRERELIDLIKARTSRYWVSA